MASTDKVEYPTDEVGYRLHTAMRKGMDSTASSYAWNVVHLLSDTWKAFCQAVADAEARTGAELKAVYNNYEAWWPEAQNKRPADEPFYARQIFRIALDDFDDDDWEGLASYLND